MDNGVKRAVLVWHRRSGKDKTALNYQIKSMPLRRGTYHYVFPEYNQGRKVLWDGMDREGFPFIAHFPQELIQDKNNTEMKITLKTGSIFQIVGSDKMDNIVGTNPIGIVFSEYPLQKPTAWDYYRPILAENDGYAIFDFTPRGMNHGWKILQQAQNDPERWYSQILTVDDTKIISKEVLEAERKEMPEALFRQEYYCDFIEGAGAFFRRIRENIYHDEKDHTGHTFQLGVDLAKYQDWTVITPFCLNCFYALPQERFNQVDWNLQKSRIEAAALRHYNARIIVDSTGVGDPIAEDLMRANLAVEPFKFTETSRRQLLDNLAVKLEQDKMRIPDDPGLISELQSFMFTLTEQGKLKVGVSEGLTDDRVFSLALSVWGTIQPTKQAKDDEFSLYKTNLR
jgi:hypothetical protein